jgi:hypothetical protein
MQSRFIGSCVTATSTSNCQSHRGTKNEILIERRVISTTLRGKFFFNFIKWSILTIKYNFDVCRTYMSIIGTIQNNMY